LTPPPSSSHTHKERQRKREREREREGEREREREGEGDKMHTLRHSHTPQAIKLVVGFNALIEREQTILGINQQ
jgi:hypothetical protein